MKIKRQKKIGMAETSASSDVAFLLIIYFLVITGFNINQGFLLNLPAKNSTRLVLKDELLRLEMDRNGTLFYEGTELTLAEAERDLRLAVAEHPNLALVLSIDSEAPWQHVVYFVELAQKLKVDSFSFNMKEKQG